MTERDDQRIRGCFEGSRRAGLAFRDPWSCLPGCGGARCRYRARCEELNSRGDPDEGQAKTDP